MKKAAMFKASIFGMLFASLFFYGSASANLNGTLWNCPPASSGGNEKYVGITNEGVCYVKFAGTLDDRQWSHSPIFRDNGKTLLIVEISSIALVIVKGPYSIPDKTMTLNFFSLFFWFYPVHMGPLEFTLVQTDWAGPSASQASDAEGYYPLMIESLQKLQ